MTGYIQRTDGKSICTDCVFKDYWKSCKIRTNTSIDGFKISCDAYQEKPVQMKTDYIIDYNKDSGECLNKNCKCHTTKKNKVRTPFPPEYGPIYCCNHCSSTRQFAKEGRSWK